MSFSNYLCQHSFGLKLCYLLQLKCAPLEDLFRTEPRVKSIHVRSVKEPDNVASLNNKTVAG